MAKLIVEHENTLEQRLIEVGPGGGWHAGTTIWEERLISWQGLQPDISWLGGITYQDVVLPSGKMRRQYSLDQAKKDAHDAARQVEQDARDAEAASVQTAIDTVRDISTNVNNATNVAELKQAVNAGFRAIAKLALLITPQ